MKENQAIETRIENTKLSQRVMGRLDWEDYIRLRRYVKLNNTTHEAVITKAVQDFLDREEKSR